MLLTIQQPSFSLHPPSPPSTPHPPLPLHPPPPSSPPSTPTPHHTHTHTHLSADPCTVALLTPPPSPSLTPLTLSPPPLPSLTPLYPPLSADPCTVALLIAREALIEDDERARSTPTRPQVTPNPPPPLTVFNNIYPFPTPTPTHYTLITSTLHCSIISTPNKTTRP